MTTIDRIRNLVREKDFTVAMLCRKIGVSKGYFTEAEAKGRELSQERLIQIANALETTVEYLRGETDQKEKPTAGNGKLSEKDKKIIDLMSDLSEEDYEKAYSYLEYLASQSKKK